MEIAWTSNDLSLTSTPGRCRSATFSMDREPRRRDTYVLTAKSTSSSVFTIPEQAPTEIAR